MNMIRLEHENFVVAERLESILRERLLNVVAADSDACGDQRSTTYVCSAVHVSALGGEEAAIARGRALKAGVMMIIDEAASCFQLTEALGGKLIRLSLPKGNSDAVANDYGLQLIATLLSDDVTVASGDQASQDLKYSITNLSPLLGKNSYSDAYIHIWHYHRTIQPSVK